MTRRMSLDEAWAEAVSTLRDGQRLVLWTDGGPEWVQVLEPAEPDCEHDIDTMKPTFTSLAAYPSKGLGDLPAALHALAERLRGREGRK